MEEKLKLWLKQIKIHESTISMIIGAFVVVVVGTILYNYFSQVSEETTGEISEEAVTQDYTLDLAEEEGKLVPQGLPFTHTVASGDHLWKISEKYYGSGYNWVDIAKENKLTNPSIITLGQKLNIPQVEVRVPMKTGLALKTPRLENEITGNSYTVVKGDTLWNIAVRSYQDGYEWSNIFQANKTIITNPNLIEVGMVLTIPREFS